LEDRSTPGGGYRRGGGRLRPEFDGGDLVHSSRGGRVRDRSALKTAQEGYLNKKEPRQGERMAPRALYWKVSSKRSLPGRARGKGDGKEAQAKPGRELYLLGR